MKRLQPQKATRLTVGVHEDDGAQTYPDGATVAEVATYNELGLGVPRRSFVADWVDESEPAKRADLIAAGKSVLDGGTIAGALEQLGPRYVEEVKARMGHTTPDALETTEEKGSSEPLDDTGLLKSSIKHKVGAANSTEPAEE